jgi:hypothetical protein
MSGRPDSIYVHLGPFSGLVAAARENRPLFGNKPPGPQTRQKVRELLNFSIGKEMPGDPIVEHRWAKDGVDGDVVSWSVGFGPRTEAFFLKPTDAAGPLPGVLALHDHGYYKYFGMRRSPTDRMALWQNSLPSGAPIMKGELSPTPWSEEGSRCWCPTRFCGEAAAFHSR